MNRKFQISLIFIFSTLVGCNGSSTSTSVDRGAITVTTNSSELSDVMMGNAFRFTVSLSGNNIGPQSLNVTASSGDNPVSITSVPSSCVLATNGDSGTSTSCVYTVLTEWNTDFENDQSLSEQIQISNSGQAALSQNSISYTLKTPAAYLQQTGLHPTEEIVTGIPWPATNRFTSSDGNCSKADSLTSLSWTYNAKVNTNQNPGPFPNVDYETAIQDISDLNAGDYTNLNVSSNCGATDWRLPSINEMLSLYDFSDDSNTGGVNYLSPNFTNIQSFYWLYPAYSIDPYAAWVMGMLRGIVFVDAQFGFYPTWAVHSSTQ